jgi:tetratricopeptide (TPR) repeat protein
MHTFGRPNVRLLGTAKATDAEGETVALAKKQLAMLAVLACAHPSSVRREELAVGLWPMSSTRSARHSLSQAIYQIRKRLGSECLEADPEGIRLGDIGTDVVGFRECLSHHDLEGAAWMYRGDLTPSETSVDPALAHRLDAARATLRREAELLLKEPIGAEARQFLTVALGVEPIRHPKVGSGAKARSTPGFVGRAAEMSVLVEALTASIDQGTTRVVIVEGEPGIGKTALCRRFVKKAVLRGAGVIEASGAEVAANLAYGVVAQIIAKALDDGWLDELAQPWKGILARVHPALGAEEGSGSEDGDFTLHQTALSIREALALKADRPLVLFVDDTQWVDPASITVLQFLASAQTRRPLLLVLSRRSGHNSTPNHNEWQDSVTIQLVGLSLTDIEYIARRESPGIPQDDLRTLKLLTRGNPLLIQAITGKGFPLTSLPPTGHAIYQHEIAALPATDALVGGALAAAGCHLNKDRISEIADLPVGTVHASLQRLAERQFVESSGDDFGFRHGLIAEEFLVSLPAAKRAVLHGKAGRLLQGHGSAEAVVAAQFAIAGSREEAFKTALGVARASEKLHALVEAEHFYRIAVAYSSHPSEEVIAKASLAELLMLRGKPAETLDLLRGSLESDRYSNDDQATLDALFLIACSSTGWSTDSLLQRLERLSDHKERLPAVLLLRVYAAIAASAIDTGRFGVAVDCLDVAEQHVDRLANDPDRIRQEVRLRCLRGLLQREGSQAYPLTELLSRTNHLPATRIDVLQAHAVVSIFNGRIEAAENSLVEALSLSERYSVFHQFVALANNLGVCYLEQGRWHEAEQQFGVALASAKLTTRRELLSTYSNYAVLKWETDDLEEALNAARRCLELGPATESHRARVTGYAISGLVQLERGQLSAARSAEHQLRAMLPIGKWWGNDNSYPEIFLARMAMTAGRPREAVDRLTGQLVHSDHLDFYSSARLEIELLRFQGPDDPASTIRQATALRHKLAHAKAIPLVERIDGVITRCRAAMAE